jgi:hypothetical protein
VLRGTEVDVAEVDIAADHSAEVSMEQDEQYYTCGLESLPNKFKYETAQILFLEREEFGEWTPTAARKRLLRGRLRGSGWIVTLLT